MAIKILENEIRKAPHIKGRKILLADTSFVIRVLIAKIPYLRSLPPKIRPESVSAKFFYAFRKKYEFHINTTVFQEFLSEIRWRLIVNWAKRNRVISKKKFIKKHQVKREILIPLSKSKRKLARLSKYLRRKLHLADSKLRQTFEYRRSKVVLQPNQVTSLMNKFILDSSDAMIANFAIRAGKYDGIVTNDSDFIRLENQICIYIPRYLQYKIIKHRAKVRHKR